MFKKAQRKSVKIKLAVTGPSGSGKTYSALKLAKGLGEKIAVIDTENGSASLYSDQFEFDVNELTAPFTPDKYIEAIQVAEKCGYDVLIIDSISHEWSTLLDQKTAVDSRGGNSFTNWASFTPKHNKFLSEFLQSSLHIICCIRSKQEHILSVNDKGKQVPQKIGLQPIQREGIEYEFTTVFDIGMNHEASVSKDRTGLFIDKVFKITEETGEIVKKWIESAPIQKTEEPKKTSDEVKKEIADGVIAITSTMIDIPPDEMTQIKRDLFVKCRDYLSSNPLIKVEELPYEILLDQVLSK